MRQLSMAVASLALATSAAAQETELGRWLGFQYSTPIGSKIEAVTAISPTAGRVTIDPQKAKATAFIFISYTCPTSMGYNSYFRTLADEYTSKGVQVVFFTSNHEDGPHFKSDTDPGVWREQVGGTELPPSYLDTLSEVANMLGVLRTPEVFVFDSTGTLRYHGAPTAQEDRKKDYARWAFDALLAGKPVAIPVTPLFGCGMHSVDSDGRQT